MTGSVITTVAVIGVDINALNWFKWGKQMGPLRKFFLINLINVPVYSYYYFALTKSYMQLQKHLVKKHLISGDELIYKHR